MIVLSELTAWLGALALLISLSTTLWNVFSSGSKQNGKKIDALSTDLNARLDGMEKSNKVQHGKIVEQVGEQEKRLSLVENEMKHLPTKEQVHTLHNSLTALEGQMKEMGAEIRATSRVVANIDSYLRKDDK